MFVVAPSVYVAFGKYDEQAEYIVAAGVFGFFMAVNRVLEGPSQCTETQGEIKQHTNKKNEVAREGKIADYS